MPDLLIADEADEDEKALARVQDDEDVPEGDDVGDCRHEAEDPRETHQRRYLSKAKE